MSIAMFERRSSSHITTETKYSKEQHTSADLCESSIAGPDLPTMYEEQGCSLNFMWKHILCDT